MSRARPSSLSRTNSALRSSSAIAAIRSFAALNSASSRSIATSLSATEYPSPPRPLYAFLGLCAALDRASLVGPLLCVVYRSYTLEGDQEHPVTRAHGAVRILLYVSGPD